MSALLAAIMLGWLAGGIYFYLEGTRWSPDPHFPHKNLMLMCMLWPVFGLCQFLCWLLVLLILNYRRPKPTTLF